MAATFSRITILFTFCAKGSGEEKLRRQESEKTDCLTQFFTILAFLHQKMTKK
jgi:hypothetical protein